MTCVMLALDSTRGRRTHVGFSAGAHRTLKLAGRRIQHRRKSRESARRVRALEGAAAVGRVSQKKRASLNGGLNTQIDRL